MWLNKTKTFVLVFLFILSASALAAPIEVTWPCPQIKVEVSFNLLGQSKFYPDIFSRSLPAEFNREECLQDFDRSLHSAIQSYKDANCGRNLESIKGSCIASTGLLKRRIMRAVLKKMPYTYQFPSQTFEVNQEDVNTSNNDGSSGDESLTPPQDPPQTPQVPQNFQNNFSGATNPRLTRQAQLENVIINQMNQGGWQLNSFQGYAVFLGENYELAGLSQVVSRRLDAALGSMEPGEKEAFLQNYIVTNSRYLNTEDQFNSYCQNLPPENCQYERVTRHNVHENIKKTFRHLYPDENFSTNPIACEEGPNSLLGLLTGIKQNLKTNCPELNPGQSKVFKREFSDPYGTGDYALKRLDEKNYQVTLNLNFLDGGAVGGGATMLARARACAAQASPYLKGPPPQNQVLNLRLLTPYETAGLPASERPRKIDIHVDRPGQYGSSIDFQEWFGCSQIIHELFHHLGLCDEYNPALGSNVTTGLASNSVWGCRVQTQGVSIMKEDVKAWEQAIPKNGKAPKLPSLLRPNHFHKILEGPCQGKSANYQKCAEWAYKSVNCNPPKECSNDAYYLGDTQ